MLEHDECQALGEVERAAQAAGQDTTIERTVGGDRYRDLAAAAGARRWRATPSRSGIA